MLKFFEEILTSKKEEKPINEHQLMTATAGLFLEMVYADFEMHPAEEEQLIAALKSHFNLTEKQIAQLLTEAKISREQRQDIWQFASILKDRLDRDERLQILTNLWRIVFADGHIDKYEDALMRKITNLLGLDHSDMIESKLQVKHQANFKS